MKKEEIKQIKQEQIQKILFNREIGWQDIIRDLINTEQLDPWDIDIIVLTDKYLEKIKNLEQSDFFVSSKVLLAAAFLLRIKSELLLNKYVKSIDEILFGNKEQKQVVLERIELDEEVPVLIPKSPLSRFKKVTLQELMESLNKAIKTENRRIKKEVIYKNAIRETGISLPKKKFSIQGKIREIYHRITSYFKKEQQTKKISLGELVKGNRHEKITAFLPLLHLENQQKLWLEQKEAFGEVYIWLQKVFLKYNPNPFKELGDEVKKEIKELDKEKKQRLKKINQDFPNPLG